MVARLRDAADFRDEAFQRQRQFANANAWRREKSHGHKEYQESSQTTQGGVPHTFYSYPRHKSGVLSMKEMG